MEAAVEVPGVTLVGVLGQGATAVVYLGRQEHLERLVAVKVLEVPKGRSGSRRMFLSESRTLGRLASHPNILTLFDAGVSAEGRPWMVTEYLPEGSLYRRLVDGPSLDWQEVVRLGIQLAGALETSHRHGVVHGDLKPQNVLVGRLGQPVLSDFGIARLVAEVPEAVGSLTPLHAAPELFAGSEPTVASDVYGLASTLFELLAGVPAAGDESDAVEDVARRAASGDLRQLSTDDCPVELAELVGSCLQVDPTRRPPTAAAVGEALRAILLARDLTAPEVPVMETVEKSPAAPGIANASPDSSKATLPPPRPRSKAPLVLAAVALLVPVVVLAALFGRSTADDDGDLAAEAAGPPAEVVDVDAPGTTSVRVLPKGGLQPGIAYDPEGFVDTSAVLGDLLAEEAVIFALLGGTADPLRVLAAGFERLPARFDFAAVHGEDPGPCELFRAQDVVLTGLWERMAGWEHGMVVATVSQFASPEQAKTMYTAFSVGIGLGPEECWGIDAEGRIDAAEWGARHRDVDYGGALRSELEYSDWIDEDPPAVAGVVRDRSLRTIVLMGDLLIDVLVFADTASLVPDEFLVTTLVQEISGRLRQ